MPGRPSCAIRRRRDVLSAGLFCEGYGTHIGHQRFSFRRNHEVQKSSGLICDASLPVNEADGDFAGIIGVGRVPVVNS